MPNTFRKIDDRPIRWERDGVLHAVEGSNVHPGIRLLWTLCEKDVPAGAAFLPASGDTQPLCERCATALMSEGTR